MSQVAGVDTTRRLKIFWGNDDGDIRGARRFVANVGAVMVVHAVFASMLAASPRREGTTLGGMKLSPIDKALCDKDHLSATTGGQAR